MTDYSVSLAVLCAGQLQKATLMNDTSRSLLVNSNLSKFASWAPHGSVMGSQDNTGDSAGVGVCLAEWD